MRGLKAAWAAAALACGLCATQAQTGSDLRRVKTPAEFQEAVQEGAHHLVVTNHLDMVLPRAEVGGVSGTTHKGAMTILDSTRSIVVRSCSHIMSQPRSITALCGNVCGHNGTEAYEMHMPVLTFIHTTVHMEMLRLGLNPADGYAALILAPVRGQRLGGPLSAVPRTARPEGPRRPSGSAMHGIHACQHTPSSITFHTRHVPLSDNAIPMG